jgi:hypothetical protein
MTAEPADQKKPDDIAAVKARLADLGKLVHSSSHLPGGVRSALISSLDDLSIALAKAENSSPTARERVVHATEAATNLVVQSRPDKSLIARSLTSLSDAAHALQDREPTVLAVVNRFAMALTEIGI